MENDEVEEEVPHVLAVDDNLIDRKLVEKLLKNSSCRVTTAENGMRALEYLGLLRDKQQNHHPPNTPFNANDVLAEFILVAYMQQQQQGRRCLKVNMIITDYCMPGMTGYELLQKIKESSMLKEVPVVIMSSENIPTRINECLEKGAQTFMLKLSDVKMLRHHALLNKQNLILQ